jgi:MFS family permease
MSAGRNGRWSWLNASIMGIVLATFFSDLSHEMATAVLPLYLRSLLLGVAALGLIEGVADFLVSISKLVGGVVGHRVHNKRLWCSLGYLVTAIATAAMGLVEGVWALLALRGIAWMSRGFRSPLRDTLMAENVEPQYYGRAYGLERAGDMLGAVGGQVLAIILIWTLGYAGLGSIIVWAFVPGFFAAGSMFFLTRESRDEVASKPPVPLRQVRFQPAFWWFLVGVFFFGLGDFSRTFFIYLTSTAIGEENSRIAMTLSVALYLLHNLISAFAAYPVGSWSDRWAKQPVLLAGYGLGVLTNVLLAVSYGWLPGLILAIILSGIYIAVEEAVEKATAAELLTPENRSLGFGILACVNAVGDMVSSVVVGVLLQAGYGTLAFGLAAGAGFVGVVWMFVFRARMRPRPAAEVTSPA